MAMKEFSAVVMAAGESKRMGRNKLLLPFNRDQSFVERCVSVFLGFGCRQVVVVVNSDGAGKLIRIKSPWPARVHTVLNAFPHKSRFYSLQLGLGALNNASPVFIHNVDNPFVTAATLGLLASRAGRADYIRPCCGGKSGHPILISRRVVNDIVSEENTHTNIRDYLSGYPALPVDTDERGVLININTTDDYQRYFSGGGVGNGNT